MAQVPATRTPNTAPQVAAAIIAAYGDLRGRPPPTKTSWLWPLALWANETAEGRAEWNRNVGNVTTSGADNVTWFYNPHVTAPIKFLSYDDERSAALAMLKVLDKAGGIAAADTGDQAGWLHALNAYLGSTYPSPWPLVAKLQDVQPEGVPLIYAPTSSPITPRGAPILLAVAAVAAMAAAAAYAAKQRHVIWQS